MSDTTAPGPLTLRHVAWGCLLVALVALVVALLAGGGSPQPVPAGLPSAGPAVGWALPVSRLLTDLTGLVASGLLLTVAAFLPTSNGRLGGVAVKLTRWASYAALGWFLAVAAQIVLTLADEIGGSVGDALAPGVLTNFVTEISQGQALLAELVGVGVVAVASRFVITRPGTAVVLLTAWAALLVPFLTGHSGASSQHEVAVSSVLIHVLSVSVWVGGLGGLLTVAFVDRRLLRDVVPRFSSVALWCYVGLALSGMANAWIRLSGPLDLLTTGYGRLVTAKTVLLVLLGVAGWWHRTTTIPQLTGPRRSGAFVRLAAAELAVMSAAIGIAVALSRTPAPVVTPEDLSGASPARLVLGFDLPPPPTFVRVALTEIRPDALFLGVALLAAALYGVGLRRLHLRGDRWPVGRSIGWFTGLALLTWATSGGIATYSRVLFSAHMIQHMTLAMVVPVLLVFGAPSTLALRVLPAHRDDAGPREWLLAFLGSPFVRILANPFVATAIFVGSFYGLYFTSLFGTLMGSHWGHIFMQTHFVLSGYLFFWALLGIDPGPPRLPYPARFGLLLIAMPLHAFFNIAVMSSSTLLGNGYFESLQRPYLTDLLADQHLGGSIGWALGEIPMVMVVVSIGIQWMRSDERDARRFDRAADRVEAEALASGDRGEDADDELAAYNRRLADLNRRDRRNHP